MGGGILAKLLIKLGLDKKEFDRGIEGAKKKTSAFGSAVKKIGGLIVAAFAVQNIIAFGKELLTLGGIAEGVRAAFNRIADDQTLEDLKEATKGTVSELDLMKRTVMASNFNIPVKQLASLFKFATKRAQETGESVDYLVNSIVLGIGRKSPLILDNLGISAVDLRKKLEGVGHAGSTVADVARAVGEIAEEAMKKSGDIIDTNATKLEGLSSAWKDMKQEFADDKDLQNTFGIVLDFMISFTKHIPQMIKDWKRWGDNFNAVMSGGISLLFKKKKAIEEDTEAQKENIEVLEEFKNLLEEVTINSEENNKMWERRRKIWDEQVDAYNKAIDLTNDLADTLSEATKKINENGDAAEEWIQTWISASDEVGKATGEIADNVASMFGDEAEEDLGFDTEGYLKSLDDFNAFKEDFKWAVVDFGTSVVDELGNAFGELAATGEFPEDFGKNVLSIIGSFISMLGKMLIGLGVASEAFQLLLASAFTNPVSAALAIAAGAGLVLLGGAIQGAAKAGPTGNSVSASGGYSSTSGGYQASTPQQDNKVVFELQGTKLIGVINNTNRVNSITR